MKYIICIVVMCCFFSGVVFAAAFSDDSSNNIIKKQLDILNLDNVDKTFSDISTQDESELTNDFKLSEVAMKAISGQLDISMPGIINLGVNAIFSEVVAQLHLMRNIILIAILSAVLRVLTSSFNSRGVSELAFYVCYILLVILLFRSFGVCANLTINTVDFLCKSMLALLPIFVVLLVSSGNAAMAAAFNPIVIFAVNGIALFIKNVIITVITLTATLQIINYLSTKEVLNQFTELLKKGTSWILKGCAVLFISILSMQRVSAPILNGVTNKSAKLVVNAIPIVGETLTASVDTVFYWAGAVKNGVSASAVIFIALLCSIPVIKLLAVIVIYKLTAALIQPTCDPRIVKCIDTAGSFAAILLGALITVAIMFIFSIMIVISVNWH